MAGGSGWRLGPGSVSRAVSEAQMSKKANPRKRNKTARYRAKLKAKHTKQRMRDSGQLRKRNGGRRLHR